MAVPIQTRRGTAAQWSSVNPILADGEQGLETDTLRVKFGNGVDHWNDLSYASSGDKHFEHAQGVPSDVWTINHNMGKYPSVYVKDSTEEQVIGEIEYVNANQVVVTFSGAISGVAYLN